MKQIDTIRAALELAREIVPPMFATHANLEDGLAALAELEKAAAIQQSQNRGAQVRERVFDAIGWGDDQ